MFWIYNMFFINQFFFEYTIIVLFTKHFLIIFVPNICRSRLLYTNLNSYNFIMYTYLRVSLTSSYPSYASSLLTKLYNVIFTMFIIFSMDTVGCFLLILTKFDHQNYLNQHSSLEYCWPIFVPRMPSTIGMWDQYIIIPLNGVTMFWPFN